MEPITIAIYFDDPGALDYPFSHQTYFESYQWFAELAEREGVAIRIVRGASYQGKMRFTAGWQFAQGKLVPVPEPIQADLIYIKSVGPGPLVDPTDFVINEPEFDHLCLDKLATYREIGEYMAPSYAINENNWRSVLENISTDRVVLKPVTGSGGNGIVITEKATFDWAHYSFSGAYLAQDFIDASHGIPGIASGVHDLRLVHFSPDHRLCYVRQAQEGTLLANLAQGGSGKSVALAALPPRVLEIAAAVDKKFARFTHRIYTIDFLFEKDRPYVGEINSRPGFPHPALSGEETMRLFHRYLLDELKQAVRARRTQGNVR